MTDPHAYDDRQKWWDGQREQWDPTTDGPADDEWIADAYETATVYGEGL